MEAGERNYEIASDETAGIGRSILKWAEAHELVTVVFANPFRPWEGRWRNLIVWDKGGTVGGGGDIRTCLKRSWELIQVARNGPMNGPRDVSVWRHPLTLRDVSHHLCAKPVELMQRIVERFADPGDTVVDPFMGDGPTGVACVRTGRHFIGIELVKKHFDCAVERIGRERHG